MGPASFFFNYSVLPLSFSCRQYLKNGRGCVPIKLYLLKNMQPARHTTAWQPLCQTNKSKAILVELGAGCLGPSTPPFGLSVCCSPRHLLSERSVNISQQGHPEFRKSNGCPVLAALSHLENLPTVPVCLRAVPGDLNKPLGLQTTDVDRRLWRSVHI